MPKINVPYLFLKCIRQISFPLPVSPSHLLTFLPSHLLSFHPSAFRLPTSSLTFASSHLLSFHPSAFRLPTSSLTFLPSHLLSFHPSAFRLSTSSLTFHHSPIATSQTAMRAPWFWLRPTNYTLPGCRRDAPAVRCFCPNFR